MKSLLFSVLLLIPTLGLAQSTPALVGTASVIDGDTLTIHGKKIRLHGVDAPESTQSCFRRPDNAAWRCGQQSALALSDFIARRPVSCQPRETDRYGRLIAVCHVGGVDLNAWLVANGWAVAYVQYSKDYVQYEAQARTAGRGIWSSAFDAPWNYRATQKVR